MSKLTHFDESGNAHMVDVSGKPVTQRVAIASGQIKMQPETLNLLKSGGHKKGDVIAVARIAAIMAAKKTSELIPLCHPIGLDAISVDFEVNSVENTVTCKIEARTHAQTGVEMEALTAVHVGLLTIYDMCKSVDRGMIMSNIRLLEKQGGKSGRWKVASNQSDSSE